MTRKLGRPAFWGALLLLWGMALMLPRPTGRVEKRRHPHWPPRNLAVYYGDWDSAKLKQVQQFDLIVAHPGKDFRTWNSDLVSRLRQGTDGRLGSPDDTLVLAYLSVGEDENPPRGPEPFPKRYLDRQAYRLEKDFLQMGADGLPRVQAGSDGIPDRNGAWGSYPVDPGDADWQKQLEQRLDRLVASGVDGFFLDTLDVAGDDYKDLRPRLFQLVENLKHRHPQHFWVANRGVGLMQTDPPRFAKIFDGILLESWFAQWDWTLNRGVPSPYQEENLRLLREVVEPQIGLQRLYLDYYDPQQTDRGAILAQRGGRTPGCWSHPFLDRLDPSPGQTERKLEPPPDLRLSRNPQGLLECSLERGHRYEVWADQNYLHGPSPWAVGSAANLHVRQVDFHGNASAWRSYPIPTAESPGWSGGDWSTTDLDRVVQFDWSEDSEAEIWSGPEPAQLKPTGKRGRSGMRLDKLSNDKLLWVSLSAPGGVPEVAKPARPHETSPPPVPQNVQSRRHNGYLSLSWDEVDAKDLDGYRVYVRRPGHPLPLPYEVHERQWHGKVPDGPLEVSVSSYDAGNHESHPSPTQRL